MNTSIQKAIEIMGGQSALARCLSVSQQAVWQWLKAERTPAEQVIPMARATSWRITPHQIRPDIYPNPNDGLPQQEDAA